MSYVKPFCYEKYLVKLKKLSVCELLRVKSILDTRYRIEVIKYLDLLVHQTLMDKHLKLYARVLIVDSLCRKAANKKDSTLFDKDGTKIYAGDTIHVFDEESEMDFKTEVYFRKGMFCVNETGEYIPLYYINDVCTVVDSPTNF